MHMYWRCSDAETVPRSSSQPTREQLEGFYAGAGRRFKCWPQAFQFEVSVRAGGGWEANLFRHMWIVKCLDRDALSRANGDKYAVSFKAVAIAAIQEVEAECHRMVS